MISAIFYAYMLIFYARAPTDMIISGRRHRIQAWCRNSFLVVFYLLDIRISPVRLTFYAPELWRVLATVILSASLSVCPSWCHIPVPFKSPG